MANEFTTLREITNPEFTRLTDLEQRFERTIKREMSLTVLAGKGTRCFPTRRPTRRPH